MKLQLEMDESDKEAIINILSFKNNEWTIKKTSSVNRILKLLLILAFIIGTLSWILIIHFQAQNSNEDQKPVKDLIFESTELRKYYIQSISKDGQVYLKDVYNHGVTFQPFKLPSNSEFQYFYEFNGKLHALHYTRPKNFNQRVFTYLTYLDKGKVTLAKNYYFLNYKM